ncbi:MAG: sigma-70 family RNA polymerase sigma factor [Cyclobacteriaceae bacterium]
MSAIPQEPQAIVDQFFRHQWGRVVSHLTGKFGVPNLTLVEDAVQEALTKAMQSWAFKGIPDNPAGWITRVAHNHVIDALRRKKNFEKKSAELEQGESSYAMDWDMDEEIKDDELKMMFACCHPAINAELQIILTLKILGGFSNAEVARQLLKKEDTIAKAYTRGKKKLIDEGITLEVPFGKYLSQRLSRVLRILYLLFNEGYSVTAGDQLIKVSLCEEAIRLGSLILECKRLVKPDVHALLALMYFQSSRFGARLDRNGRMVSLEHQDRMLWDHSLIELGKEHLELAAAFGHINDYFIQASIARVHCDASTYEGTNWRQILMMYDIQLQLNSNPVIFLNRVIAYGKVHGAEAALRELRLNGSNKTLEKYPLRYAVEAELLAEKEDYATAIEKIEQAISLNANELEVAFMKFKKSGWIELIS